MILDRIKLIYQIRNFKIIYFISYDSCTMDKALPSAMSYLIQRRIAWSNLLTLPYNTCMEYINNNLTSKHIYETNNYRKFDCLLYCSWWRMCQRRELFALCLSEQFEKWGVTWRHNYMFDFCVSNINRKRHWLFVYAI